MFWKVYRYLAPLVSLAAMAGLFAISPPLVLAWPLAGVLSLAPALCRKPGGKYSLATARSHLKGFNRTDWSTLSIAAFCGVLTVVVVLHALRLTRQQERANGRR